MPPPKRTAGTAGTRSIQSFFRLSQVPFSYAAIQDDDIGDEIVVASAPSVPSSEGNGTSPAALASSAAPAKRGPGRPRKQVPNAQLNDDVPPLRRGPGRPRKGADTALQQQSSSISGGPSARGRADKTATGVSLPPSVDRQTHDSELTDAPDTSPVSPSQQVLTGSIAFRSPKPSAEARALPTAQRVPPSNGNASISFSSVSSLSSVPASTQSSSRRIVVDGLKGVTNSESEDGSSSGEDLPDVMALFPRKRRRLSTSPELGSDDAVSAATGLPSLRSREGSRFRHRAVASPEQRKHYKYDLAFMAAKAKKQSSADAKIAKMEDLSRAKDHDDAQDQLADIADNGEALAVATAGSDADEKERMMHALQRTEALQATQGFHFFLDDRPLRPEEPFPLALLPDQSWSEVLGTESSRALAFSSGLIAQMAAHQPLDTGIINWMASQLLHEKQDTLCEAYVQSLEACALHGSLPIALVDVATFYKAYTPTGETPSGRAMKTAPRCLAHLLHLVSSCAPAFDITGAKTSAAFFDLALIKVDECVNRDYTLSATTADCISTMLERISPESSETFTFEVVKTFRQSALPLQLHAQVIAALPAGTLRTYKIRRQLAFDLLAGPLSPDKAGLGQQEGLASILHAVKSRPEFHVSDTTDYKLLQSLAAVLDIAIGAGNVHYDQRVPTALHKAKPGPFSASKPLFTDAARLHDEQIDALTMQLQAISGRIRGAGTAHLARTEAKSAIERLIVRLEHSVRTRPKPRRTVFGQAGATASMKPFLQGPPMESAAGKIM